MQLANSTFALQADASNRHHLGSMHWAGCRKEAFPCFDCWAESDPCMASHNASHDSGCLPKNLKSRETWSKRVCLWPVFGPVKGKKGKAAVFLHCRGASLGSAQPLNWL
ncbi:unnamed protein product [Effrenium voratum]|uniref:Uncharacterized protein n=1 Tax=Effrenium voratum TaxID=2562239 RepID=A0AA36JMV0_9DINO|nr:unnamed protein product [Effrenium voratum]CAJ1407919.1 unnamed protein product [Effrenium voratum]